MGDQVIIRQADRDQHHKRLCQLARTSKFTNSFSSIMFSSEEAYRKGWIRLATVGVGIVGFTCVRHKVRAPETILYFITVDPNLRSHGIGEALMRDLEEQTPHRRIVLDVAHQNERARTFYERLGYRVVGEKLLGGTTGAWVLLKELD